MTDVIDNKDHHRYQLEVDGQLVIADYRRDGNIVQVTHVEAPVSLRGSGAAGQLMLGMVELARQAGDKIYPVCPYAVHWLNRHPEHNDIIA